jgi:hypothetical protein
VFDEVFDLKLTRIAPGAVAPKAFGAVLGAEDSAPYTRNAGLLSSFSLVPNAVSAKTAFSGQPARGPHTGRIRPQAKTDLTEGTGSNKKSFRVHRKISGFRQAR